MEQGNCLDSTSVSARQNSPGEQEDGSAIDAAVTRLLTTESESDASFGGEAENASPPATPALATMIAEWVAMNERMHFGDLTEQDAEYISGQWYALQGKICRFRARGLADLCAKLPIYLYERDDEREQTEDGPAMPLRAWESVVRDIEAIRASLAPKPVADPILVLIEEGRRLLKAVEDLNARPPAASIADENADNALRDALQALWSHNDHALLKTIPLTGVGCRELARFADEYNAANGVPIVDDGTEVLRLIAQSPSLDAHGVGVIECPEPAGDDRSELGVVLFEDAAGIVHRTSVANWIAFMAARLNAVARSELARKVATARSDLSGDQIDALYNEARRELRVDAVHDLAFRSDRVYAGRKDAAVGHVATQPNDPPSTSNDAAVFLAIDAHKQANKAFDDAVIAADRIVILKAGGDTSDAALAPLEVAAASAGADDDEAWRGLFHVRPATLFGLLRLLRHTAKHYDRYTDVDDAPDVFEALIGAVEGLRFALQPRPAEHDLSLLSIAELEQLARIASRERETLMAVESQGFCWNDDRRNYSRLGRIIEAEGERMAFLGDHAINEIERRQPTDKIDTNLRLEALVRHHLNCNGYIEPELLSEVVQAWGRA